ncbi:hypothetical protein GEO21_21990 [Sphingobacterium faecium]|uniref:hypothetical protein n=1 Tax=Sphingobacterium faecium TaxID=34087 RepID=UPI001291FB19|nr:hypothetical protein [Sphingobacterium faecium]MQP30159.1 hypothetical protein [Sphingobacterium faecium]
MTAILSWFNKENKSSPYIMTVGDTMISGGEATLTLEGAKIMELPVKCKDFTTPIQELYFCSSIGFAYSGSTLVGFNVYCALQTIFSNLGGLKLHNHLPDYISLAKKAEELLAIYSKAVRSISELMLFGYCPKLKVPFITTIKPYHTKEGLKFEIITDTNVSNSNINVSIIGDKKEDILNLINAELLERANGNSVNYWRTPALVLKKIVEENYFTTIGGNLQLATITPHKYETYSIVDFIKGKEPEGTMKYRNIDVFEDMGRKVGDCWVSINGIQIEN